MKRSTWIVLVIFLALAGTFFYLNEREGTMSDEGEGTPTVAPVEYLLAETDGLPSSIEIKSDSGEQVRVERNDAGEWVLTQPIEAEANQGSAEAAATQLTSLRIVSRPQVAPADAGLDQPSYKITVELTSGTVKNVRIGDLTPTESGYYTNIDESDEVLIVSKTGLDSLLMLITSPPYVDTPTPEP
ncbi:MAG: DUF4340 domain-containing protein [Anaerolineales bacterium]|jgi:hypothetical protein